MSNKIELTPETKYQLLLTFLHKLRDTLDLEVILHQLLDTVDTIVTYDAAGVFILNEDLVFPGQSRPEGVIAAIATRGFYPTRDRTDRMLAFGEGIIGHVIHTCTPIVAPDVRFNPHYIVGRPQTRSEIAVPIERDGRAIGALNLESDHLNAFDESDVEILRFFADAASLSVEKAMLHRRLLAQKRVEDELRIAQEVQARLLPGQAPEIPGYDIAGLCIPTHEVGGDYYDYVRLDHGELGVTVADVSGKGIPAAMIMTAFRALLRTHARRKEIPETIARAVNQTLPEFTAQSDFVTAVYGILTPATGAFTYANCGHNPPLLVGAGARRSFLPPGGPLLGIFKSAAYASATITLAPGDWLILYTDGVIECEAELDHPFGVERLLAVAREARDATAPQMIDAIVEATHAFTGRNNYEDDFTLLVIRRCPAAP
jgi:sigma-B regulation protein RsbU (phosphoserine phosphatase)